MIGRLRGLLVRKQPNRVIVECGGVGYVCAVSLGTYGMLPDEGAEAVLHTELLLRENELSLIGFATISEQEIYRLLVKVDGVGPKLALAALGALPLEDLVRAIRSRDVKALTRVPGVGKKTAEKLCFELSERLGGMTGLEGLDGNASAADSWESDLRSALTNLGFREDQVLPLVKELKTDRLPLDQAIRVALKAFQR